MLINVLQGEVWEVQFDPSRGSEQRGLRPALVISNSNFNGIAFNLVVVVAITSTIRGWDNEVRIDPPEGGLENPSVVLTHQIRTVTHDRLISRRGQVTGETLDAVMEKINLLLARPRRRMN